MAENTTPGVVPVTNYDFTPQAAIERLERLLADQPLKVVVVGGGIEREQRLKWDQCVLISRDEVQNVIRLLNMLD